MDEDRAGRRLAIGSFLDLATRWREAEAAVFAQMGAAQAREPVAHPEGVSPGLGEASQSAMISDGPARRSDSLLYRLVSSSNRIARDFAREHEDELAALFETISEELQSTGGLSAVSFNRLEAELSKVDGRGSAQGQS